MKIIHLCLSGTYTDGFSYQENMLSKYHRQAGHTTTLITNQWMFSETGARVRSEKKDYMNNDNVHVIRLPAIRNNRKHRLQVFPQLMKYIKHESPDVIFVHGLQFLDVPRLVLYIKKNPLTRVYVDNHADYSNSATNKLTKVILHGILWRLNARLLTCYVEKFYGVLPARVDFLTSVYKIPKDKCSLLVMGADDEFVDKAKSSRAYERIRKQYGIDKDDFLIITGGKIDKWKTQTLLLMQAVQNIHNTSVRLIVFGSVTQDLIKRVSDLADGHKVQYIGWVLANNSYELFEAADLVVFPGRHSVMWEQVAGQGKPMLVKDWPGTHHVDLGGNVHFLTQDSVEEIQQEIETLVDHPDEYQKMRTVAQDKGIEYFSYKVISERAIQEVSINSNN